MQAAVGGIACGGDAPPVAPHPARSATLAVSLAPANDTVTQRGVDFEVRFSDGAAVRSVQVTVDSGPPVETYLYYGNAGLLVADGGGRRRIVFTATDTGGYVARATTTRVWDVPDAAYTATPLPDHGQGAVARGISATGDGAGAVVTTAGVLRPAVWHAEMLRVLGVPDRDWRDERQLQPGGRDESQPSDAGAGRRWAHVVAHLACRTNQLPRGARVDVRPAWHAVRPPRR